MRQPPENGADVSDYFGRYADFETVSKKDAGQLLGADNLIGDVLSIECGMEDGEHRAWLINRFDKRVGFFDSSFSRELSLVAARGLEMKAVLSFVAFTDSPGEGFYWGQAAIICFEPFQSGVFEKFISNVSKRMGDGVRTAVDLGQDAIDRLLESGGEWVPTQTVPMPTKVKGTAVVKSRRSITDKLVESGRAGNKGCFIASWVVLLAAVTLIIFGLKSCFF